MGCASPTNACGANGDDRGRSDAPAIFAPRWSSVAAGTGQLEDGERAVEISIRDTGEGIPPDKLDYIFKRFSQISEERSEQKRGTGLGLVFSREIVELHRGRIRVESTLGEGASFVLLLPVEGP